MSVHLQRALDKLKKEILSLCALVEDQVQMAVRALLDRDAELAAQVEQRDLEIDHREIEVEEDCLKALALHQPVAGDLRFVVAALKINNDLERIGDLAVNIAHKAKAFASEPPMSIPLDIDGMWRQVHGMLRDAIDSMVNLDAKLAHDVCRRDDSVDQMKHQGRLLVENLMCRQPELIRPLLRLLAVTRNLERIADCATNIAEDVVYMIEGKIIRHAAAD
jgi:phosphate transport system protein